ncbi:unnamed protein product, partial [Hapterophycus canaliculatus]
VFGGSRGARAPTPPPPPFHTLQVSATLDKVQMATEEYFAGIRRTVFSFDEVMNEQRLALYRARDDVINKEQ